MRGIRSEAYKTAQEIIGKADAEATAIYASAYNQNAQSRDFYSFLKTMETYRTSLSANDWLVRAPYRTRKLSRAELLAAPRRSVAVLTVTRWWPARSSGRRRRKRPLRARVVMRSTRTQRRPMRRSTVTVTFCFLRAGIVRPCTTGRVRRRMSFLDIAARMVGLT